MYRILPLVSFCLFSTVALSANLESTADTKDIIIGNTAPYSGPASAYGTIGKAEAAYFNKINAEGGINGHKIIFLSRDDGYNPAKTVEQTRKLIEQDHALFIFSSVGTAPSASVQPYLNSNKIPQMVASGSARFRNPKEFPWSIGMIAPYTLEAQVYADYVINHIPNAKIGILYQNDDYGKEFVKAFQDALGSKASTLIVQKQSYNVTDPTVDSQIVNLKASGANVFLDVSGPKFAAQAIRKMHDVHWTPVHILNSTSALREAIFKPSGYDKVQGLITVGSLKEPSDPKWKDDKAVKDYVSFMKQYYPEGNVNDMLNQAGYAYAQAVVQLLKECGNDLSRENIMKHATHLKLSLPIMYPGIEIETSPTDYSFIKTYQLVKIVGDSWEPVGSIKKVTSPENKQK